MPRLTINQVNKAIENGVFDSSNTISEKIGSSIVDNKDDIKILNHFASIAKSGELKGLIVAGKYAGFTDTYRLATVKDSHEELSGTYAPLIYPILEELKKANSIAVLKNGKIAVQVEMEVTEYEPLKDIKVPNISKIVEDLEYESYSEAYPTINFSEYSLEDVINSNWTRALQKIL